MSLSVAKKFPKRYFDPTSNADLKAYASYRETKRWTSSGCPFVVEWPFLTAEAMILDKIMNAHIKTLIDKTSGK